MIILSLCIFAGIMYKCANVHCGICEWEKPLTCLTTAPLSIIVSARRHGQLDARLERDVDSCELWIGTTDMMALFTLGRPRLNRHVTSPVPVARSEPLSHVPRSRQRAGLRPIFRAYFGWRLDNTISPFEPRPIVTLHDARLRRHGRTRQQNRYNAIDYYYYFIINNFTNSSNLTRFIINTLFLYFCI